ncbi:MAG: type VII toxin-antitoxin system MntA family adenylyltransferase antitoxin [Actinomycetota bacterium]
MSGQAESDILTFRLADRLRTERDVLVAYLFGSAARGRSGSLSDVDVAVLFAEGASFGTRHLELIDAVTEVVGSERADVVVLNEAPAALAYRVLKHGRAIVVRDERARLDHWCRTVETYLDMEPIRRRIEEGLRHRLQEGRFGRP